MYIVQKFITFFIENIWFTRIKGLPLRHDSKNFNTYYSVMKHNFCAGPAVLPQEVIEKSAQAVYDFAGTGISILSISHRSSEFKPVVDEAEALIKEILDVREGY